MNPKYSNNRPSLYGMDIAELTAVVSNLEEPRFRSEQLFNWIYNRQVSSFDEMTNLPKALLKKLSTKYVLNPLRILKNTGTEKDITRKYLMECNDGKRIESVLMKDNKRITICVSSQVGCALGCKFCATGTMGIIRNLSVGEIIAQYLLLAKETSVPITNVVFMGMGEPFLNYDDVIKAANLLNNSKGINLGARHITISTAGIIPQILQFAKEKQRYKLAISLNGTTQEQRLSTMPIAKKYQLAELVQAVGYYYEETSNLATFEYVLLAGINDSQGDANRLMDLLDKIPCKLNVIPYNEIDGEYKRPGDKELQNFLNYLSEAKFTVTTRWSKGADINAGCGQLIVN